MLFQRFLVFSLEATPGFEPGIRVLQTRALPLGYVATMPDNWSGIAVVLARVAGFEPANDGIRIRCLTAWLYPISINILTHYAIVSKKNLGWMVGFEPTNTGATTQGLNHLTTPTTRGLEVCKKWRPGTGSNRRPPA